MEEEQPVNSDAYSSWSGAPKQWFIVPAQRQAPPRHPLAPPSAPPSARPGSARRAGGGGTIAALAIAAALLALGAPGLSVGHLDRPAVVTPPASSAAP